MMNEFYTNCTYLGDYVLYRGIKNGKRFSDKIRYKPTLYVESKSDKAAYQTVTGVKLDSMEFNSIGDAWDYMNTYEGVGGSEYFGNIGWQYNYLYEKFGNKEINFDYNKLVIANLDIETYAGGGFIEPNVATGEVTAITCKITVGDKYHYFVFGCGEFDSGDDSHIKYIKCDNEKQLLREFLYLWKKVEPDIVTGWNISGFDLPYLITRCGLLFGEEVPRKFSPWNKISERTMRVKGSRPVQTYAIYGVAILDYMELYKLFKPNGPQESYSLDHIASVELKEKKISYKEEYGSLHGLYTQNYQKYIEYNIKDVALVDRIDKKVKLIELVVNTSYDSKVNFDDVFYQTRMWDALVTNYLRDRNIIVPRKQFTHKTASYAGAYIKEPIPGRHDCIISYDINSLYPSLMVGLNISNDTLLPLEFKNIKIDDLAEKKYDLSDLKKRNRRLAANGYHFSAEKDGFFPEILHRMYLDRVKAKKSMLEWEKELENINQEMSNRKI